MQDLRHYITIIDEARKNPALNTKIPTYNIIQQYSSQPNADRLYLHFNNIEKVGINIQSQNTYGPFGIYAFPLSFINNNFNRIVKNEHPKYANILELKSDMRVLNLDTLTNNSFEELYNQIKSIHKKVTKSSNKHYVPLTNNFRQDWYNISKMISDISRRKNLKTQSIWNSVFRLLGYDAIYDSSSLLNDNPDQIIFLHSNAFRLIETIPIRVI